MWLALVPLNFLVVGLNKIPAGRKTILLNGVAVGEYDATGDPEADAESVIQFLKKNGLHKETSPFSAVFNQALSFATAANYLFEKDLSRTPHNGASAVPFVVNAAFSIELYLKALSLKHGIALHGHKLSKLYNELPIQAKSEIQEMAQRCAIGIDADKANSFVEFLHELNNTFVEWRYSFEKERTEAVYIEPTIFVMRVLHEACRLQKP